MQWCCVPRSTSAVNVFNITVIEKKKSKQSISSQTNVLVPCVCVFFQTVIDFRPYLGLRTDKIETHTSLIITNVPVGYFLVIIFSIKVHLY